MQSEVVCVNCCGGGVLPASMDGQRRLKSMMLRGAVYAILVHERAYAWRTTAQGNDCYVLRRVGFPVCSPKRKCAANTELAAVRH